MKVILLQDVKNVGKKNEVIEVSDGYANNFLIKKGLAVAQTKGTLNELNKLKEEERKRDIQNREQAMLLKEKLKNIHLLFEESAGKEGKLHHAITAKMIEEQLKNQYGIVIDKKNIKNFVPLKAVGEAIFEVVLYKDITAKIEIEVIEKHN